jgi:UDP-N-acetylmuramyl pentapeptide synthase
MGEVGTEGIAFHEEIGRRARDAGVTLMAIGPLMQNAARVNSEARHFAALPDLIEAATGWILAQSEPSSVLVKGSRFMRMERVAKALSKGAHAISEGAH